MAEPANRQKPSKLALAIVPIVIGALIIVALVIFINKAGNTTNSAGNDTAQPMNDSQAEQTQTTTPDPVKSDTDNGDTTPSSTGTGPEGNNSLLSQ